MTKNCPFLLARKKSMHLYGFSIHLGKGMFFNIYSHQIKTNTHIHYLFALVSPFAGLINMNKIYINIFLNNFYFDHQSMKYTKVEKRHYKIGLYSVWKNVSGLFTKPITTLKFKTYF